MYKKHGRDRESNLELTVKPLVTKALEEQGLSTKPQTLMALPEELALVGSPPEVPSSQGSTTTITPINRIHRRPSGTPMTSSSLRTKLKKSQHGLLRRPSPANNNRQRSIQMLMLSNGQRIARKHMKKASPSYQTETSSAYHLE